MRPVAGLRRRRPATTEPDAGLPSIVGEALTLGWQASPRDTVATVALNLAAGVLTTLGLLAASSVLTELFAGGPTPDRVRAALPALLWTGAAITLRGALTVVAGWAQARLTPQIDYQAQLQMFRTTASVRLEAFDDADFAQELDRVQFRGMREASQVVDSTIDLLTGLVGVAATAVAVTVIEPVLLPCLLLAALPTAVTAIRVVRRHQLAWVTRHRRMWLLGHLMAQRMAAAEIRIYQLRDYLVGQFQRIMRIDTRDQLRLVRSQTVTRAVGSVVSGIAGVALYAALAGLLLAGAVPLAAAVTALFALELARRRRPSTTYPSPCAGVKLSPWSERTAPASRPWPSCSPVCTPQPLAPSPGTAWTPPPWIRRSFP